MNGKKEMSAVLVTFCIIELRGCITTSTSTTHSPTSSELSVWLVLGTFEVTVVCRVSQER